MIDFDLTKGLIYEGSTEFLVNELFPRIRNYNHKMRILYKSKENLSMRQLMNLFIDSWKKFKIFDFFILLPNDTNQNSSIFAFKIFHKEQTLNQLVKFDTSDLESFDDFRKFENEKIGSLNGFELQVVIFRFMMVCDGNEYRNGTLDINSLKFQDAENLKILSKYANFSVKLVNSPDKILYGYQDSNFKLTGSLGMSEYEHVDLAANSRIIAEYNTSNNLFLFPTTSIKLKFCVPRKLWLDINLISAMTNLFDYAMLWSFPIIFAFSPFLLIGIEIIHGRRSNYFEALTHYFLMIFAIMTSVSISMPNRWSLRLIIMGVILFWLNIGSIYSGKMIEFLNTNYGLKQISSIEEMSRAKLDLKIPYPMITLFENEVENMTFNYKLIHDVVKHGRTLERNGDRMAFIDVYNMDELINSKRHGLMFLDFIIEFLERSHYDNQGNEYITHFDETPYEFYWAMTVPKTSPFVSLFNKILIRSFEAGIAKYQMNQAKIGNDLIMIRRIKLGRIPNDEVKPISLTQLFSILFIYGWSIFGCFVVFVAEVLHHKIRNHCRRRRSEVLILRKLHTTSTTNNIN